MHPAPSVIFFSTLSGLGLGLLVFLGLGQPDVTGWVAFFFYLLAYLLAVGGLFAAFFHLANKKNAWRSFSQWRSSWLSREALAAPAALGLMGLYAVGQIFFGTRLGLLGVLGAALSLFTVFTTSMIYTQLRTVPRWNQWATPALFLVTALAGGALLSNSGTVALWLFLLGAAIQAWHWWNGDQRFGQVGSSLESATRLNGQVSVFERPHTGDNYLTREMVFRIGRKHAVKLRVIAMAAGYLIPALICATTLHHWNAALAVILHVGGVLTSRWLFFAEAEHVVGLYYGSGANAPQAT